MKSKCSDFRTTSRASQERWSNRSPWWKQAIKHKIIGMLFANRQNCTALNVLYPFFFSWNEHFSKNHDKTTSFIGKVYPCVCVCFLLIKFWDLIRNREKEMMSLKEQVFHDWACKTWMLECSLIIEWLHNNGIHKLTYLYPPTELVKFLNTVWLLRHTYQSWRHGIHTVSNKQFCNT